MGYGGDKSRIRRLKIVVDVGVILFYFYFFVRVGGGVVWDIGGFRKKSLIKWRWCGLEGDGD